MIEDIKREISRLIALYEAERARAEALANELEGSRDEVKACRKQITELQDQIEILRLKGAFGDAGGSHGSSREMVDELIREIDKCISLLGS